LRPVHRHPNGDEENANEKVAKGTNFVFELMAKVALAHDHAYDKGADR